MNALPVTPLKSRRLWALAVLLLIASGLGVLIPPAPKAAAATAACTDMAASNLFKDASISSAKTVPADPGRGLPAYCELKGFAFPSEDSRVGVIFRLPEAWNGKFLGLGGTGWAGDMTLETATPGLTQGYATAQTDTGHPGIDPSNINWALASTGKLQDDAVKDFGYRAVHAMTDLGRRLMLRYYGKPASRTYFEGCGMGGRQGMMEAQRFPDDYDAIIAGAPAYDFTVQTSAVMRTQAFHDSDHSNLMTAQAALLAKAVIDACDGLDGLKDGIISDPRLCRWDPAVLQCKAGQDPPACLSPEQVVTVRKAYAGAKTTDGRMVAWPLPLGSEADWATRSIIGPSGPQSQNLAMARGVQTLIYKDAQSDLLTMTPDEMLKKVNASPYHVLFEAKDPDLGDFNKHGGKLLLYHGLEDTAASAQGTIQYYAAAKAANRDAIALYLIPGVYGCRGGPGPDRFDMLGALDQWVTSNQPPATIAAANAASGLRRPLCPYPALPTYSGSGDPKATASFACHAPQPGA